MSTAVRKYLFDTSFDAPGAAAAGSTGRREGRVGAAELETLRAHAFGGGKAAGLNEAMASLEARLAGALETTATLLTQVAAAQQQRLAEHERASAALAAALLGRLAPSLARRTALDDIA